MAIKMNKKKWVAVLTLISIILGAIINWLSGSPINFAQIFGQGAENVNVIIEEEQAPKVDVVKPEPVEETPILDK